MASVAPPSEPSDCIAEDGKVIAEGPNGIAVTLTPEAEETGKRMIKAASAARLQARD